MKCNLYAGKQENESGSGKTLPRETADKPYILLSLAFAQPDKPQAARKKKSAVCPTADFYTESSDYFSPNIPVTFPREKR